LGPKKRMPAVENKLGQVAARWCPVGERNTLEFKFPRRRPNDIKSPVGVVVPSPPTNISNKPCPVELDALAL
jgi:hypothetical protein